MMFGRRSFMKSLSAVGVAVVTPITTKEAFGTEIVLLKTSQHISQQTAENIRHWWLQAVKGTSLEHVKAVVIDGIEVELVRKTGP